MCSILIKKSWSIIWLYWRLVGQCGLMSEFHRFLSWAQIILFFDIFEVVILTTLNVWHIRVNNHDLGSWFCGNLKIFSRGCSFSFLWQVSQSVTLQSCSNFKSWKPIRKFSSLLTPWAKLWYKGGKRLKTDQISKQQTFEILKFEVS